MSKKIICALIGGAVIGFALHFVGFSFDLAVYGILSTIVTTFFGVLFKLLNRKKPSENSLFVEEENWDIQKESQRLKTERSRNVVKTREKRKRRRDNQRLATLFVIYLACIVAMVLLDGRKVPPVKDDTSAFGEVETTDRKDVGASDSSPGNSSELDKPLEPFTSTPWISEMQWQKDPYFLNIDEYCGYPVPTDKKQEEISDLLKNCLSRIEVRGPFSSEKLNGAHSEYAWHTAKANEYAEGKKRLASGNSILSEYQREFDEEAAKEREEADALYEVCDNEMCLGDLYVSLGNYCRQENINKAMEYYDMAFQIYTKAYRTGIAEGIIPVQPSTRGSIKEDLTARMENTSEKMCGLQMDTEKQKNVVLVAAVFRELLPSDIE